MKDIFEKFLVVGQDDLDDLSHVNNVRYVQWIQDISKEHWQGKAPRWLQDTVQWVVLHHDITYKRSAKLGDNIRIKTFIDKTRGATSIRVVEMYNKKTGELLVESKTDWCLLSGENMKPMRISKEIEDIFRVT